MRAIKYLTVVLLLTLGVWAKGTVSVFIFKDGKPLANNEIKIDGHKSYKSDKDGSIKVNLSTGKHQIEIYGKSTINLGYFKKMITVKKDRDTQVIASFTKGAKDISVDTPRKAMKSKVNKVEAKGKGILVGHVLTTNDKKPIEGARVFVKGTAVDARTDANGKFSVEVPAGVALSISVVHSAYSSQTKGGIKVPVNGTGSVSIALTPASMELEEFVVLAPKVEGSITDIIAEEKNLNAIANILGAEEFSKKGDGSAAAALKRVTGVTLIGGKSIFVRGLGERYSNIELNSLPLPSPDPTKRVVPLDIFPSSVIGSLKVQKSGTADIPSSFGGGYVDIRTKDKKSGKDYIQISLGLKANSNTGEDVINYTGSDSDWTGFDDGYRDIPAEILEHAKVVVGEKIKEFTRIDPGKEEVIQLTKDYTNRNFAVVSESLPFAGSMSIEGLKNYTIKEDHKISIFGTYKYAQDHKYQEEEFFTYRFDNDTQTFETTPIYDGVKKKATSTYSQSGMLNIGYNYLDVLQLKYTKLYTHIGEKNTRLTDGVFGSNQEHLQYYYLDWEERTLSADQLNGAFDYKIFNRKSHLDFGIEYATAKLEQPSNISYLDNILDNGNIVSVVTDGSLLLSKKLYSEDDVYAFNINNKIESNFFSDEDYIKFGGSYSTKERTSQYQKFYLAPSQGKDATTDPYSLAGGDIEELLNNYVRETDNYDDRLFLLTTLFSPADYFDAKVDDSNYYFHVFTKPIEKVEMTLGIRYVNFQQTIYQYEKDTANQNVIIKTEETLEVDDFFPAVSLKYKHDDNNHFDFAASKTYIAPDLREFTSGKYFHPYDVATVHGNPDLVHTIIYSADLKYSHYFSDDEYVKAGAFYKYLDKPIEDTQLDSSSLPIYSYMNSDSATLYGIEFDWRKKFDFVSEYLKNYYISGNFSYTNSEVTLAEERIEELTSNNRQLQGLSQIVTNLSLGYDSDERNLALSYNKMGERIRKVGLINEQGVPYPDSVEIPPHLLDFVWIEKFDSGLTLKLKFGNLIDDETIWKQGENVTQKFKKGRDFSFGISYKY